MHRHHISIKIPSLNYHNFVLALTPSMGGTDYEWLQGTLRWPWTSGNSRKDDAVATTPATVANKESKLKTVHNAVEIISKTCDDVILSIS